MNKEKQEIHRDIHKTMNNYTIVNWFPKGGSHWFPKKNPL